MSQLILNNVQPSGYLLTNFPLSLGSKFGNSDDKANDSGFQIQHSFLAVAGSSLMQGATNLTIGKFGNPSFKWQFVGVKSFVVKFRRSNESTDS